MSSSPAGRRSSSTIDSSRATYARVVSSAAVARSSRVRSWRASSSSAIAGTSTPRWRSTARSRASAADRVRTGHVVGDLGEVAERRCAGLGEGSSRGPTARPRAPAGCPGGPGRTSALSRPGADSVPDDRHRPGVRHRGRDGPEADPLGDAEALDDLDDRGGELAPAVVRLGAGEDEDVALGEPASGASSARARSARPAGRRRCRGSVGASGSRTADRRRTWRRPSRPGQVLGRGRGRRAAVDPAVERGDDRRRDEVLRLVEMVEAHEPRIGEVRPAGGRP